MSKAFPTGVNRVIPTALWSGPQIVKEETPENKLFMAYLMSGTFSNNIGIHYVNVRYAKDDLGYDEKVIRTLIRRFNQLHSIIWSEETQEVAILDHLKYATLNSAKFKEYVVKDLRSVENTELLIKVYQHMKDWWDASPREIDHYVQKAFDQELRRREVPREDQNKNINRNINKNINIYKGTGAGEPAHSSTPTDSKDKDVRNDKNISAQCASGLRNDAQRNAQNGAQESAQNDIQNAQNKKTKLSNAQIEEEFEKLWKQYPNKKDKKRAFSHYKAWRKESSTKHTFEYLQKRLDLYNKQLDKDGRSKTGQYILNGSTWFNGRFDDELDIEKENKAKKEPHGGYDPRLLAENNDLGVNDDDLPF